MDNMIIPRALFGGLGNRLFQMAYLYSQFWDGVISDIYLQDESYFGHHKDKIKALFGVEIKPIDMVSIHVRRGDYLNNSYYAQLTETDYYERAMDMFPDEKFLIFCKDRQNPEQDKRDMEWCKEKFQGKEFEFWEGETEIDDLNAMAGCKGHIIANSSFSYWGAYLGEGKVIAPKEWFAVDKEMNLPEEWIRI